MAEIPLHGKYGKGKVAIVDEEDFDELNKYKWFVGNHGYAQRGTNKRGKPAMVLMHREILNAPKGKVVDHINMEKLDNRKSNLRIACQAQNMLNCEVRLTNTSGYKGVHWSESRKKWRAAITKDYKNYHIGMYDDKKEAARAYDFMAFKFFGEFAKLNFPNDLLQKLNKPTLRTDNMSGYRGVSWNTRRRKWQAQISNGGKRIYSQFFECKHLAARKYNEWASEIYGERAKLNDIEEREAVI